MLDMNPNNGLLDLSSLPPAGKSIYVPDSQIRAPGGWHYLSLNPEIQLFQGLPSTDGIYQGAIGHCYLIAALLAMADQPEGQQFIQQMMTRLSGNRVIVRLYHYLSPIEITPIFYELDATILVPNNSQQSNPCKAVWVYFIEKAYAAHRLKLGERINYSYGTGLNQAQLLDGGFTHYAFEILLGKPGEKIELPIITLLPPEKLGDYLFLGEPMFILYKVFIEASFISNPNHLDHDLRETLWYIFRYTPHPTSTTREEPQHAIANATKDFLANYNEENRLIFCNLFKPYTMPRYETFKYYIDTYLTAMQPSTKAALYSFIQAHILRKRGTADADYVPPYVSFYNTIYEKLAQKSLVCIYTTYNLGKPTATVILKGLQHNHAYQVINCYTRAGIRFLLIRQRGGLYIRNYYRKNWTQRTTSESQDNLPKRNEILSANSQAGLPFQPVNIEEPFIDPALPITKESLLELIKCDPYVFEITFDDFLKYGAGIESCDPGWVVDN